MEKTRDKELSEKKTSGDGMDFLWRGNFYRDCHYLRIAFF